MAPDEVRSAGVPAAPAPQIVIQQSSSVFGRYGKWLLAALGIALMVIIGLYNRYQSYFTPADMPQEKYHSLAQFATKKIAIIDVSGPIYGGENSFVSKQIERVRQDQDVVGVVLRVNSPGGTVTGSDYIYHHLRDLAEKRKLPIVVSMGSVCASGGYYISMAVGDRPKTIFAEPTTWTGSIGVIIPHFDVTGGLEKLGIAEDSIVSGPLKEMGSPTHKMTPEEKKVLQSLVDDSFQDFKAIVTSGRPKLKEKPADLEAVTTGQIFTAKQALSKGLIDEIGFIDDAIARATELAGESADSVRCVKYEKQPSFWGSVLGVESRVQARGLSELSAVLEAATPRAYYLWSWLPTLMSHSD